MEKSWNFVFDRMLFLAGCLIEMEHEQLDGPGKIIIDENGFSDVFLFKWSFLAFIIAHAFMKVVNVITLSYSDR